MYDKTSHSQNEAQTVPAAQAQQWGAQQGWCSVAITQPGNEELWSPAAHANKELTFKPNYINTALSC